MSYDVTVYSPVCSTGTPCVSQKDVSNSKIEQTGSKSKVKQKNKKKYLVYPFVPLILSKKFQVNPLISLLLKPLSVSSQSSTILDLVSPGIVFWLCRTKTRRALGSKWDIHVFPTPTPSFPRFALDPIGLTTLGHLMRFTQCNLHPHQAYSENRLARSALPLFRFPSQHNPTSLVKNGFFLVALPSVNAKL